MIVCPFCISTVVSVAAGTITTAGVGALFAFARRIPSAANDSAGTETTASTSDEPS